MLAALVIGAAHLYASAPNGSVPAEMVITVNATHRDGSAPEHVSASDIKLVERNTPLPVERLYRLSGNLADMQLFILLDDSTRSSSLGIQLPALKTYVKSLPAATQVAIGYMHNGTFAMTQAFTPDHQRAADALRLPAGVPGENGSPYFALSDLARHWPSQQTTSRRAVLMLTDGVDRYYDTAVVDDPYVDAAIQGALKNGMAVYSIYLRGAGFRGRGGWVTTVAQSRLNELSEETGGYAYFQDLTDPVTIEPFLKDFQNRLDHQYKALFQAPNERGLQPIKLRTELPGVKIEGPSRIFVR
jgi:hypothetical protein